MPALSPKDAIPTTQPETAGPSDDVRWQAVLRRDLEADGTFVLAVKTTGIYCRPICTARQPLRKNVRFFADPVEAEAAGFRACKRCRPEARSAREADAERVARAIAIIRASEVAPQLDDLARQLGQSPFHFHRIFKAATGITPKAYFTAERAERLRREIDEGEPVTSAIYGAGYGSSSRFYETSDARLGMTAGVYRKGAAGVTMRFALGQTSLGSILVAATDRGIAAVTLGDDPDALLAGLQARFPSAKLIGADADFERHVATIVGLIEAPGRSVDLPLDIRGTAFQEQVWQALRQIPPGTTATYTEIAARIGRPASVRAVANACGANPIAVLIPCHRVVRTDGSGGGYRWGIDRKAALIQREVQ
jgi:AraC family transcriptional regulator of adaptative response/methylated-DNA-[protein]-cysteine methyltransferase